MKTNEFLELVRRMRTHQKRYFEFQSKDDLQAAKQLEKKVDAVLAANSEAKQQKLF